MTRIADFFSYLENTGGHAKVSFPKTYFFKRYEIEYFTLGYCWKLKFLFENLNLIKFFHLEIWQGVVYIDLKHCPSILHIYWILTQWDMKLSIISLSTYPTIRPVQYQEISCRREIVIFWLDQLTSFWCPSTGEKHLLKSTTPQVSQTTTMPQVTLKCSQMFDTLLQLNRNATLKIGQHF